MDSTDSSDTKIHKSYTCSNCGAPVNYVPGNKTLYCEYCKSYSSIAKKEQNKKNTSEKTPFDGETTEIVRCHKCHGIYEREKYPNTQSCIFCDEPVYLEDIHEHYVVQPVRLLPFHVSEQQFIDSAKRLIKAAKVPSPFANDSTVSNLRINKVYVPCWITGLDMPTDRKQLSNPRFAYKNKFIEARRYLGLNIGPNDISDELGPFDRLSLIPIRGKDIGDAKVLVFSFPTANHKYVEDAVWVEMYKNHGLLPITREYGVKDWSLVLVPIYECRYTYKGEVRTIHGNGHTGYVRFNPKTELMFKEEKKKATNRVVSIVTLSAITLITIVLFCWNRAMWEKEWGMKNRKEFIASYTAYDMVRNSPESRKQREKVPPIIDSIPIGKLTVVGESADYVEYKLYDMTYGGIAYKLFTIYDMTAESGSGRYWVIDVSDLKKLDLIKDKEPTVIGFRAYDWGFKNNPNDIKAITKEIPNYIRTDFYHRIDLIIYVDKKADKVAFKFEEGFYAFEYELWLKYNKDHKGINELKDGGYETSYSDFSKLLKLL